MPKKYMVISYPPKIKPVNDGRCTQTIRKGNKINVGDIIEFHNWKDKAYRSKWINRFDVMVTEAIPIYIDDMLGIATLYSEKSNLLDWNAWDSIFVNQLAKKDFIYPPNGEALKDVLFKLNDPPKRPEQYQIIRW